MFLIAPTAQQLDCRCYAGADALHLLQSFYADFARVADDESRHLSWCLQRLKELGHAYGDMVAHNMLWEGAEASSGDSLWTVCCATASLQTDHSTMRPIAFAHSWSVIWSHFALPVLIVRCKIFLKFDEIVLASSFSAGTMCGFQSGLAVAPLCGVPNFDPLSATRIYMHKCRRSEPEYKHCKVPSSMGSGMHQVLVHRHRLRHNCSLYCLLGSLFMKTACRHSHPLCFAPIR